MRFDTYALLVTTSDEVQGGPDENTIVEWVERAMHEGKVRGFKPHAHVFVTAIPLAALKQVEGRHRQRVLEALKEHEDYP